MQLKIEKADFKEISLDKISEALQSGLNKKLSTSRSFSARLS